MRFAWVCLVMLATTGAALACPPPPPGGHCSKYDHLMKQLPVQTGPVIYVHAVRGKLPSSRAKLMKQLTESVWRLHGGTDVIQFLDGSDIPDDVEVAADARTVIVRQIEKVDGAYRIDIDGNLYTLKPCSVGKRKTTCLALEQG